MTWSNDKELSLKADTIYLKTLSQKKKKKKEEEEEEDKHVFVT